MYIIDVLPNKVYHKMTFYDRRLKTISIDSATKANPDLGFRRHGLLKPPRLLLSPLPQSLSDFGNLSSGFLSGSAVVPQKLLDVSGLGPAPPCQV